MAEQYMPGYDAATKWTPWPEWREARLERNGWTAYAISGLGQTLVSGRLAAARTELASGATEVGLWQLAEGGELMVRIARDRALIVTEGSPGVLPGWRAEGYAASPADDAWVVLEISGSGLRELVAEAVTADLDAGSRSAAIPFAGATCLLYRTRNDRARLHVETGLAPYVWRWLETR